MFYKASILLKMMCMCLLFSFMSVCIYINNRCEKNQKNIFEKVLCNIAPKMDSRYIYVPEVVLRSSVLKTHQCLNWLMDFRCFFNLMTSVLNNCLYNFIFIYVFTGHTGLYATKICLLFSLWSNYKTKFPPNAASAF